MPPMPPDHQPARRQSVSPAPDFAQHIAILDLSLDQFEDTRVAVLYQDRGEAGVSSPWMSRLKWPGC